MPKHVAPDPDIRTRFAPAAESMDDMMSISGRTWRAGGSRSLRREDSAATHSLHPDVDAGKCIAELFLFVSRLKMAGVETGCSGLARTREKLGKFATGMRSSPMPRAISGLPFMHIGRSAPICMANWVCASVDKPCPQSFCSPRRVAAASADPPPIPDARGKFFSR